MTRLKHPILRVLQGLVLIALVAFIVWGLDFKAIWATLSQFPPQVFLLAIVLQLLGQAIQAWRWKMLMGDTGMPYRDYFGFVASGSALAIISPSMLISDSANAYVLGLRNQLAARSVSAMLLGRLFGMFVMGIFLLAALPSHLWVIERLPWRPRTSFFFAMGAGIVGVAVLKWAIDRHPDKFAKLWREIRTVFTRPRALVLGFTASLGVQVVQVTLPWLGYHAMGVPIGLSDLLFFMPLITLLSLLPISIGQIGVREGLNIFFFTLIPGVTKEHLIAGLGYGYALIGVMALINIAIAGALLKRGQGAPPATPPPSYPADP